MNIRDVGVCWGIAFAICVIIFLPLNKSSALSSSTSKVWGETVAGCHLRTVSINASTDAGDALDIVVELENTGKTAINIFENLGRPYDAFTVEVLMSDGSPAPKTAYALSLESPHDVTEKTRTVRPGEKLTETIRLNRLRDLSQAGTYAAKLGLMFFSPDLGQGKVSTVSVPDFKFVISGKD